MTPAEPGAEPAAPGAARPVRWLTPAAFASEAEATSDVVERLLEAGVITARPDGRLAARDEVIASTAQALLDAGIRMDDLIESISTGQFGLRSLALIFSDPVPRTARPYAAITSAPNADPVRLSAVYAALGLPEPEPEAHPRADEAELLLEFVRLWNLVDPTGDAQTRVARIVGDATRRIAEGWLDVWDEVAQPGPETQGAPTVGARPRPADPTDPAQNPSIGMAEVGRRLVTLMHERHLQATLNARILSAFERALGEAGRLPPRPARPTAVAFVDLSGFTSLTETRGDEAAATVATRLHELAETAARAHGGRVVKQLGDGVLLRFGGSEEAIRGVLALCVAATGDGLPDPHAGIAAGPVIVRDGDVFGRTVNLAARLATRAGPGEILVEEGVVVALPRGTARFEPIGRVVLPGFAEPVAVWRAHSVAVATQGIEGSGRRRPQ